MIKKEIIEVDLKSVYEEKPWVRHYSPEVPAEIKIPDPMKSINEIFNEATEKWKNKTALIFYGNEISYQKLREYVDRFATALSNLGIKKGDKVALLLLNCPQFIIAFYGSLKVGAILTLISPVYVSNEIKHQLQDSGAEHIICLDILYEGVEKTGLKLKNVILTNIGEFLPTTKKIIGRSILRGVYQKMASPSPSMIRQENFYQFQDLIKKYPPTPPKVDIDPKEDFTVFPYTGGTTGPPKGVLVTHFNIIINDIQYQAFLPFLKEGEEFFLGYMPFYHMAGLMTGPVRTIFHGFTLVIIANPDLDEILNAMVKYKTSSFLGAPAIYESLKDYDRTNIVNWKKLKFIASSADALHEFTAKDWEARTGTQIHEYYGQTEQTATITGTPQGKVKIGSIGVPLPSIMAAIADLEKDAFLPLGELGELVVRGPQMTKGYWNNPGATRECEALINGVRWWRTGDVARMDEDGYFYIYDRKRDIIKYKGLQVLAREVEEVLKTHPKIREVGVIGVPDIKVGENVKALVVLEADARGKLSESDIIEYCNGKLAHYKIPRVVEFVGEIPKTDVGKVSRRELREGEG
jgi:long-chain acyl-CoA synthetase